MLYPSPAASCLSWMPPADRPGLFPVRGRVEIGETEALGLPGLNLTMARDHGVETPPPASVQSLTAALFDVTAG